MSTLTYVYNGSALTQKVPPTTLNLPGRAELGSISNGSFGVEDPTSSLTLTGWKPFYVSEADCSQPRIFMGYIADRKIGRSDEQTQIAGVAHVRDTTIVDLNAVLTMRIIWDTDGKRPAETMEQRLTWILGSSYLSGLLSDTGFVSHGFSSAMDAADYRDAYPDAVFADLSSRTGDLLNYFVFWDPVALAVGLFYGHLEDATFNCTISISNVTADINGSTVFPPDTVARLQTSPETVYSDVIVEFANSQRVHVYANSTACNFIRRGTKISRPYTGKSSTAIAQGQAYLAAHSSEVDRIATTIRVPSSVVGLIQAGMRMTVKFSHMPGYTSNVSMRIVACTPTPVDDWAKFYNVALELIAPRTGPQAAFAGTQTPNNPASPTLPRNTTPGNLLVMIVTVGYNVWHETLNLPTLTNNAGGGAWTTAVLTNAYDSTQYGGPGPAAIFGIYWRRVASAESTTTPVSVNAPGGGPQAWLWEFSTPNDPGAAYAFTTGTTPGSGIPSGGTATLNATSGFSLGGFALQSTTYEYITTIVPISGSTVQGCGGDNKPYAQTLIDQGYPNSAANFADNPTWIATSFGAALSGSFTYAPGNTGSVLSPYGVAGGVIELPGVSYAPTIPYPANSIAWPGDTGTLGTGATITPGPLGTTVTAETPTPATNGTAVTFTLANAYLSGSLQVSVDGIPIPASQVTETSASAGTFTLSWAPDAGEQITVTYSIG